MIKILDSATMRSCDEAAIERHGIPGAVLMENAGLQVLEALVDRFGGQAPASVAVVCGKGNNGGDGMVVARHLHNLGRRVRLFHAAPAESLRGDAALQRRIVASLGVDERVLAETDEAGAVAEELAGFEAIVDAVLGTGVQEAARGIAALAIEAINRAGRPVVAVDLPSGLTADRGALSGPAVRAEVTVTFGAPKPCHVLPPACEACGDLELADIGIPRERLLQAPASLWLVEPEDLEGLLPPRPRSAHKGAFGRVLIVGGARGMAGAAVLAGRAAARAGAGLVTVACPEAVYVPVAAQLTECLVRPLDDDGDGGIGSAARAEIERLTERADVVALGPGAGTTVQTRRLLRSLAHALPRPVVVDADGLNALVGHLEPLRAAPAARVLTPHPGEAARLLQCDTPTVQEDRVAAARELAERSGAVVVLKGFRTVVVATGRVPVVIPAGNPGMATGGSGDVLTGVIAALLAQGVDAWTAAWAGAMVHGLAGDRVAAERGEPGLVAGDLVEVLPETLAEALAGAAGE